MILMQVFRSSCNLRQAPDGFLKQLTRPSVADRFVDYGFGNLYGSWWLVTFWLVARCQLMHQSRYPFQSQ